MMDYIMIALVVTGVCITIVVLLLLLFLFTVYAHVDGFLSDIGDRINEGFSKLIWC